MSETETPGDTENKTAQPDAPNPARTHRMLLLLLGVMVAVVYSQVLLSHSRGRWVAPLRDDLIFLQYARSLADGHPYRYFPNAEKTTGATSHLYVWAVAQLARLTRSQDGLIAGVFFLNAAFWLVSLLLAYGIARCEFESVAFPAAAFVALTGPISFGFFACHDMGLATMLFLLAWWSLVAERWAVAGLALFLLSWARPEGLLVALALILVAVVAPRGQRRPAWVLIGLVGVLGTVGVIWLNRYLTGDPGFTSMNGKGLLGNYPLYVALREGPQALAAMAREIFLGWTDSPRAFYFIPLIAIPLLLGLIPRLRWASVHAWVAVSAVLILLMVSVSGYAGLQHDKYLLWVMVLAGLYGVAGLPAVEKILGGRIRWPVLYALCVLYALVGTAFFLGDYARRVLVERAMVGAVESVRASIGTAPVGVVAGSGVQYYLPATEVINISGVTHRAFRDAWAQPAAQYETLEDFPNLRPAIWFLSDAERGVLEPMGLVGRPLFSTPGFFGGDSHETFYEATWDRVGDPVRPRSPAAIALIKGRYIQLMDRIDLGSPDQETRHRYHRFTRLAGTRLLGGVVENAVEGMDEGRIIDAGYAIPGDESFDVNVWPGRDLLVVVRVSSSIRAVSVLGPRHQESFEFALAPPVRVNLFANDEPVELEPVLVPNDDGTTLTMPGGDIGARQSDRFEDKVLIVPARYVTTNPLRLRIAGDHIAYHYWFFQEP